MSDHRNLIRPRVGEGIKLGFKSRAREDLELELAAITEDREESDDEAEPPPDPPESHELQEAGYNEVLDSSDSTDFEPGHPSTLLWFQQNEFFRPTVRFWIDNDGLLHELGRPRSPLAEVQRSIAKAIAAHIQPDIALARQFGGWCHIPAIGSIRELIGLAVEHGTLAREDLESEVNARGKTALWFAIVLPSREIITPKTLAMRASTTKRATLAGVLRLASARPATVAGELWTETDWKRFEHAQQKKRAPERKAGKTRL